MRINQRHIPEEILTNQIFLRLPVKSLVRFRYVCKLWNSIISSRQFRKVYVKESPLPNEERILINTKDRFLLLDYENYEDDHSYTGWNYEFPNDIGDDSTETLTAISENNNFSFHSIHPHISVVASCNGLVCLETDDGFVYIWNPTTLERVKIPCPPPSVKGHVTWGFGYVSSIDDYKLVRIVELPLKKIQVFSFNRFTWKTINLDSGDLAYDINFFMGPGVWFNDMICWAINWSYDYDALEASGWDIIGFNLASEEFMSIYNDDEKYFPYGFSNCPLLSSSKDGCLHFCLQSDEGDFNVLSYKQTEEEDGSSRFTEVCEFRHVLFSMYERFMIAQQMLGVTKTGRYIFHLDHGSIVLLHPDDQPTDDVHFLRIPETKNVIKCVESLLSPFDLVERQATEASELDKNP